MMRFQEAMLQAWKSWDTIKDPAPWVNRVAVRGYWRLVRRRQQEVSLDETVPEPADADLGIFAEEQQQVLRLLRQLPPSSVPSQPCSMTGWRWNKSRSWSAYRLPRSVPTCGMPAQP